MLSVEDLLFPLVLVFIITIILIVIFTVFIISYNKKLMQSFNTSINNEFDNYKDKLKEQNEALVKQILEQVQININSANVKDTPAGKNLMNIFVKLKDSIKESCVDAMNQIGAARIAIYLFHNGVRSTHGISFFKMSCICEKVTIGSGIKERMMEHTNLPVNLFDEMIEKLITYNRYIIINNEETQESTHKMFISADKINYTQLVTIYDINNNMLGFVAVEMNRPYSKEEADREKRILDELVKQLVPVLSYSDYISINPQ